MGAYLDLSAMNAALKELYDDQVVMNMVYKHNPMLAMVKKKTDVGGKYRPVPIISGVSQGRSSTFTNAQGNQSAVQIESFLTTRASDYSIATIDNQTMLSSRTDKMSFLEGAKLVVDGAIRSITNSLASSLFRSGTGSIGQIASIVTTGAGPFISTITLIDTQDIVQFERNMYVQSSATDGGTPSTDVLLITSVNRSTGVFVATSAATPSATWTTGNPFVLVQGDSNLKIKGLAAWLPPVAPTVGDNFFGVDRSIEPTRLAGLRYDGSNESIEEALIDAISLAGREDAEPTVCFMNHASFGSFIKALGSKVQYVDVKGPAGVGFTGVKVQAGGFEVTVYPDRNVQPFTAYVLDMASWELDSAGEAPMILRYGDGLEMLRVANADAAEVRVGYYAQLTCNAPGHNVNVKLSA